MSEGGIGARIREMRRAKGLSQTDIGAPKFSASYMSLIESGRRQPTEEVLEAVAQNLGVTAEALKNDLETSADGQTELDLRWAELSLLNGEARAAEEVFRRVAEAADVVSRRANRKARWGLARAQEALGDPTGASATLLALAEVTSTADADPTVTDIVVARARCYRLAGDISLAIQLGEDALAVLRTAGAPPSGNELSVMSALAYCYEERGDLLRASEIAQAAVAAADVTTDHVAAGRALWAASTIADSTGRLGDAIALADRGIAYFGESLDERRLASLQVTKAWLELKGPSPDLTGSQAVLVRAIEMLQRVGTASEVGAAKTELAKCLLMQGQLDEACAVAITAAANSEGLERARALIIEVQTYLVRGDQTQQINALNQLIWSALGEAPQTRASANVWREFAELLMALGKTDEALAAYRAMANACQVEQPRSTQGLNADRASQSR